MPDDQRNEEIVIVGAGPVGLITAIQILEQNPQKKIAIIERHAQYVRTQTLFLEINLIKSQALKSKLLALAQDGSGDARYNRRKGILKIKIQKLEACLLAHARGLPGISIITNCQFGQSSTNVKPPVDVKVIENEMQLQQRFPHCKTIIGADGIYSKVRKACFGEDDRVLEQKPCKYMMELKYRVKGKVSPLDLKDRYPTEKMLHAWVDEGVHYHQDTDQTEITVRFFVDKADCEAIRALPKVPNTYRSSLVSSSLPEQCKKVINTWMNVRRHVLHEEYIDNSATVSAFPLNITTMKEGRYSVERDGISVYLVGDAACSVPFFRALNNGIANANHLVQGLADDAKNFPQEYNDGVSRRFAVEELKAGLKSTAIDSAVRFAIISDKVPWQTNKWFSRHRQMFEEVHPAFVDFSGISEVGKFYKKLELDLNFYIPKQHFSKLNDLARQFLESIKQVTNEAGFNAILKEKQFRPLFKYLGKRGWLIELLLKIKSFFESIGHWGRSDYNEAYKDNKRKTKRDIKSMFFKPVKTRVVAGEGEVIKFNKS